MFDIYIMIVGVCGRLLKLRQRSCHCVLTFTVSMDAYENKVQSNLNLLYALLQGSELTAIVHADIIIMLRVVVNTYAPCRQRIVGGDLNSVWPQDKLGPLHP